MNIRITVAAILLLAALFRLWQLPTTPPGLYHDEAMNGVNALQALETGEFKVFYPENNGREGLFINLQALSVAAFGHTPLALRLVSALIGIATVAGIYLLTRELFDRKHRVAPRRHEARDGVVEDEGAATEARTPPSQRTLRPLSDATATALLAAFFLATSYWHVNFSRTGFRAVMAPLLLTWAIFLLLRGMRTIGRSRAAGLLTCALGGAIYGLGFHSYIAYRFTPPLILLLLWSLHRDARRSGALAGWRGGSILFIAAAGLAILPLLLYLIEHPAAVVGRAVQVSVFSDPDPLRVVGRLGINAVRSVWMLFGAGDANWRHNYSGNPQMFWGVAAMLVMGAIAALTRLRRGWDLPSGLLLAWILIAALPGIMAAGMPHALRTILMVPPLVMLAADGARGVWTALARTDARRARPILAALLIACGIIDTGVNYFLRWGPHPETAKAFSASQVEIGRQALAAPASATKYIVWNDTAVAAHEIDSVIALAIPFFITGAATPAEQERRRIRYIGPDEAATLPPDALRFPPEGTLAVPR